MIPAYWTEQGTLCWTTGPILGPLVQFKHWFYDFMKRHPELSLRQAEATSTARARGFNKRIVGEYFDKLEALIDKHRFDAAHIFNVDESGITTVQKPGKVIARRGKKQVGSLTSDERGFTTTVLCCFSASGTYVHPMMIFKRKRLADELNIGAPPGSNVCCNESGWMTKELFVKWLKHCLCCRQFIARYRSWGWLMCTTMTWVRTG